jgi:hypothetical protein
VTSSACSIPTGRIIIGDAESWRGIDDVRLAMEEAAQLRRRYSSFSRSFCSSSAINPFMRFAV